MRTANSGLVMNRRALGHAGRSAFVRSFTVLKNREKREVLAPRRPRLYY